MAIEPWRRPFGGGEARGRYARVLRCGLEKRGTEWVRDSARRVLRVRVFLAA